jgi:hypothetical protein
MKPLRKLILFATGILALVNLVGLFLDVLTLSWRAMPWKLLHVAGWAAICVYMIILDRRGAASPPEKS